MFKLWSSNSKSTELNGCVIGFILYFNKLLLNFEFCINHYKKNNSVKKLFLNILHLLDNEAFLNKDVLMLHLLLFFLKDQIIKIISIDQSLYFL